MYVTCVQRVCVFRVQRVYILTFRGVSLQWWKTDTRGLAVFSFYLLPDKKIREKEKGEKKWNKKRKIIDRGRAWTLVPMKIRKKKKRIEVELLACYK